jgi:fructokinase
MILVCGEILIDMVPRATPGKETGFYPCPGGSPANTAIAIGRLDVPTQFLGRISGDFFGDILVRHLQKSHVGTDFVIRSNENSTLAFVKLAPGEEPEYLFYAEGTADRSLAPADMPAALPPEILCIVFGSIAMTMEPAASAIETLILREHKRNSEIVISFDPNIRPFMIRNRELYIKRFATWLAASSIVKISAADFEFIYPGLNLKDAMVKTLNHGPRLVVATLGKKGAAALLRRNNGAIISANAPAFDFPVADTIGAGDTFHGAFLACLERHNKMSGTALEALSAKELYNALCFANKAAAIVCSRQGAEPPTLKEMERYN